MSTANYRTMESFPLYVNEPIFEGYRCPICGAIHDDDYDVCPACGETVEMEDGEYFDPFFYDDLCGWVEEDIEQENELLNFHEIRLMSGYYIGVQFYVEEKDDLSDYDDDDCMYYFDCNLEAAQEKLHDETEQIKQWLETTSQKYVFTKKEAVARFGNGYVLYR